jgi:hypothetical protein
LTNHFFEVDPSDPRYILNHATYTTPVAGAQASQTRGNDFNAQDSDCETGHGAPGQVSGVVGPKGGNSLICVTLEPDDELFLDAEFTRPPGPGEGQLMPIPTDSVDTDTSGEAVAGSEVTGLFPR